MLYYITGTEKYDKAWSPDGYAVWMTYHFKKIISMDMWYNFDFFGTPWLEQVRQYILNNPTDGLHRGLTILWKHQCVWSWVGLVCPFSFVRGIIALGLIGAHVGSRF